MATATATATARRAGGRSGVGRARARGTRATRGAARARRAARGDDDGDGGMFWIHTARARTTLGDVARAHGCAEETLMRFNVGGAIEEGMEVLIPYGALAPRAARERDARGDDAERERVRGRRASDGREHRLGARGVFLRRAGDRVVRVRRAGGAGTREDARARDEGG